MPYMLVSIVRTRGAVACARLCAFGSQFVCLVSISCSAFVATNESVHSLAANHSLAVHLLCRIRTWYPVGSSYTLFQAQSNMSTHNVDSNTLSTAEITDPHVPIYESTPGLALKGGGGPLKTCSGYSCMCAGTGCVDVSRVSLKIWRQGGAR